MAGARDPADPVLACGEVRTCLLQNSRALPPRDAAELLRLRPDERVRLSERPNAHAVSPDVLTGVDCRLPAASGARVRAVGTVVTRATLTEGRVLQVAAHFRCPRAGLDRRQPWAHHLTRPGVVEPFGTLPVRAVVDGFLTDVRQAGEPDLGAIAERLLARLLRDGLLDQRAPFKSRRTRLRWAALRASDGDGPSIARFTLAENGLRTVELRVPEGIEPSAVVGLCEDLALHDWLLSTLVHLVERSRLGSSKEHDAVSALRPAVHHLLHLWMPNARVHASLGSLWEVLEREPGFTRQWQTLVQRIRDHLSLLAVALPRDVLADN